MLSRRQFMAGVGAMGFRNDTLTKVLELTRYGVEDEESYWTALRKAFQLDESLLQFNHAGLAPSPKVVEDAVGAETLRANMDPSLVVYRQQPPELATIRSRLAALVGCPVDCLALTPNATYGLHTGILGWDAKPGPLVVTSHEYPRAVAAVDQRVRREGFSMCTLDIDHQGLALPKLHNLIPGDARVGVFSQVTYVNGSILPIRDLCRCMKDAGGKSVVDGAQALGLHEVSFESLGCDVYTACLHKWIMAPVGTGVMALKPAAVNDLWPLHPGEDKERTAVSRFEHWGTRPYAPFLAIREALDFHDAIGRENKLRRIRALRKRIFDGLEGAPKIKVFAGRSEAIHDLLLTVGIENLNGYEFASRLMQKKIHVSPAVHGDVNGVRVSPNLFTRPSECDQLIAAIRDLAK